MGELAPPLKIYSLLYLLKLLSIHLLYLLKLLCLIGVTVDVKL